MLREGRASSMVLNLPNALAALYDKRYERAREDQLPVTTHNRANGVDNNEDEYQHDALIAIGRVAFAQKGVLTATAAPQQQQQQGQQAKQQQEHEKEWQQQQRQREQSDCLRLPVIARLARRTSVALLISQASFHAFGSWMNSFSSSEALHRTDVVQGNGLRCDLTHL